MKISPTPHRQFKINQRFLKISDYYYINNIVLCQAKIIPIVT